MDNQYSLKNASAWTGAGLGVSLLTGIYQSVAHHAADHFATLTEAFAHVAQPEAIIGAVALSAAFGGFMEFSRWWYKGQDINEAKDAKPDKKSRMPQNDL